MVMAKKHKTTTPRSENFADDELTGIRAAAKRFRPFVKASHPRLSKFAALWLVLAAVELSLNFIIPGSILRNAELPVGARLLLFCYSLTLSALFLAVFIILFSLFTQLCAYCVPGPTGKRVVSSGFGTFATWVIVLLYSASWGTFWQIGSFIDSRSFFFVARHALQVFHWIDLDVALAVVGSAVLGTLLVHRWLPRRVDSWKPETRIQLILTSTIAIGICVLGTYLGHSYSGTEERQYMRSALLYEKIQDSGVNPFTYVITDVRKYLRPPAEQLKTNDVRIIQRPIISMEQYVALANQRSSKRWNVIMLIVESMRADQLRVYGANRDVMPATNELASEARVFLNAYSQASHTDYATVTPFSSHFPLRSKTSYAYPEKIPYPRVLIYDVLKALGYHTAIFSSSNEYWSGMINFFQTGNLDRFFHAATFKGPTYVMQGDAGFADWTRETKHAGSVDDRYTVAEAIGWIDGIKQDRFFVAINFQSSHIPYMVPRDFQRRFGPEKLDFTIRFAHFPRDKVPVVKDIYADSLAYVDLQIAKLFQFLKSRGLWENTIIVLTGDHGQAFYEHNFASHASAIFDEVMRVPLLFRAPGLKSGMEDRLAQHVDIAPSILGLLGLPTHPSFQGIDLFNSVPDPKHAAYMLVQTPLAYQYGIVRSGMKLIYDEREQRYALFDLTTDPGETNDIAASQPDRVNELGKRLQAWRTLQINYYADPKIQKIEYPPILAD
jgi:arylsulfatase A-like enzyme